MIIKYLCKKSIVIEPKNDLLNNYIVVSNNSCQGNNRAQIISGELPPSILTIMSIKLLILFMILQKHMERILNAQKSDNLDSKSQPDSLNFKPAESTNISVSLQPLVDDKQLYPDKQVPVQRSLEQVQEKYEQQVLNQSDPSDNNDSMSAQSQNQDFQDDSPNEDNPLSQEGESMEYEQYQKKYTRKGNKNKGKGKQKRKIIVKRVGKPSKKDKLRNKSINQHLSHFWRDIKDKLLTSIHNILPNNTALISALKIYKKSQNKKMPEKERWYSKLFNDKTLQIYIRECLTQDNYRRIMNKFICNENIQYYRNNRVPLLAMLHKNYLKGFRNYYHSKLMREDENQQNN